jgi:hypothetical protein
VGTNWPRPWAADLGGGRGHPRGRLGYFLRAFAARAASVTNGTVT